MDLSRIFKSKVRKALFQLYFTNDANRYYLRQLERMLNMPVALVRKELLRLEKEGLFISEKEGNLTYFFLNKDYPLFEEFKSIVFKTVGVQGLLKDALNKMPGVESAFIYGSYAKSSENADSDIDLFIVGTIPAKELQKVISPLENQLKREIVPVIYPRAELKRKINQKNHFIQAVISEKKVFLKGDGHGFRRMV